MAFSISTVTNRWAAAAVHMGVCLSVGAILLVLFIYVWYPLPTFSAIGGLHIFFMLLAIDIVLGPLLTLVVFRAGKRSLKFDLAVIGCVQIAALVYGVSTLLAGRPVYVAALGHRFDLIQASEINEEQLISSGTSLPWWGPKFVGTVQATEGAEVERMMFSGLAGADYGHYPQYHAPLESMRDKLLANAKPMSALRSKNPLRDAELTAWLSSHGHDDRTAVFQGLKARSEDMAVILDAMTASVIGIAPFKPWD